MKVVVADRLTKVYPGGKKALDSVDLSIKEGEIFGFLGPNGAGKTTAVKLFNGMLQLTEGSCSVFGIDPADSPEKVHNLSGVVTEHAQMYNNLSGLANLMFFGSVFNISEDETKRRALEIMERLSLLDARDQKLGEYSTGMRQRLSLARALIHQPKILFLDEPTSGLDPESAQNVNNLIKNLARSKGTTVFLCTHQLRYAEEICTQYGLISEGKILASGSLDELHSLVFAGLTLKLKIEGGDINIPGRKFGIEYTGANCNELNVEVNSIDEIPGIVRNFVDSGGKVYHVSAHKHSLEEIYFALIEKRKSQEKENDQ
ncbi:MAG: ABC transporter ATP-binding protein [Treponema sp.]|jgi:ABC-2 type transport system ATP-binding protein|nr:ABC transporter ATP-binding protein [Treponema sp.]